MSALTTVRCAGSITLFATIAHAAGAREVGIELPDEVLLVFGDPAVSRA